MSFNIKDGTFESNLSNTLSDLSPLIKENTDNLEKLNNYISSSPSAYNIHGFDIVNGYGRDIMGTFKILSSTPHIIDYFVNSSIALKAIPALFVQGLEMEIQHNKMTHKGYETYRSKLDLKSKVILNVWNSLTGVILDSVNSEQEILPMILEKSIEGFDKLCIKNLINDYKKLYDLDNHESVRLGDGSFFPKLFQLSSIIGSLSTNGFPLVIMSSVLYTNILASKESRINDLEKFKRIIIKKDLEYFNLDPNELILTWCSKDNPSYILGISDIFTINLSNNSICTIIDGGILDESKFAHIRVV